MLPQGRGGRAGGITLQRARARKPALMCLRSVRCQTARRHWFSVLFVFSLLFGIFGLIAFLRVHQLIAKLKVDGVLPADFDGSSED